MRLRNLLTRGCGYTVASLMASDGETLRVRQSGHPAHEILAVEIVPEEQLTLSRPGHDMKQNAWSI